MRKEFIEICLKCHKYRIIASIFLSKAVDKCDYAWYNELYRRNGATLHSQWGTPLGINKNHNRNNILNKYSILVVSEIY